MFIQGYHHLASFSVVTAVTSTAVRNQAAPDVASARKNVGAATRALKLDPFIIQI